MRITLHNATVDAWRPQLPPAWAWSHGKLNWALRAWTCTRSGDGLFVAIALALPEALELRVGEPQRFPQLVEGWFVHDAFDFLGEEPVQFFASLGETHPAPARFHADALY